MLECMSCPGEPTPHAQQRVLQQFNATTAELLMACCRCGEHRTWIAG